MIQTRNLTPADANEYWTLRLEALETSPRAFSAGLARHRDAGPEGCAVRLLDVPNGSFVVGAFLDGALVGTVGLAREGSEKTRHGAFIWGVYVSDRARRLGAASAMFIAVLQRVRGYEGLERLTLDVDSESVRAMGLYQKFGFRSFGLESHALKVGDEYVDLHHMALDLR